MRVLIVDIGGSHIKLAVSGTDSRESIDSSDDMGPTEMLD